MAKESPTPSYKSGARRGTATRKSGRETASRLVAAAHDLLETETYERFSMRNVAERAGVSLANLQYYFPKREDLARALCLNVGERYQAAYEVCLAQAPEDPVERFKVVLRYNMQDISRKSTRQFFIQLWALLGALDEFRGKYLEKLYAIDIQQLRDHIKLIHPHMDAGELERRATVIAAMIEGLLVVTGKFQKQDHKRQTLYDAAFNAALKIACAN